MKTYEFIFHKAEVSGPLSMRPALELVVHHWHTFNHDEVGEEELQKIKEEMLDEAKIVPTLLESL